MYARAARERRLDARRDARRRADRAADDTALPAKIGRYEVRRLLGQGGMGMVLAAWDPQLEYPSHAARWLFQSKSLTKVYPDDC